MLTLERRYRNMGKVLMPVAVLALVAIAVFMGASVLPASDGGSAASPSAAIPSITARAAAQSDTSRLSGITVEGEGSVRAQPDLAYVMSGVQNVAATAQAAQQENARLMNAVVAKLESMGYIKKDMRTTGLSIRPVYERNSQTPTGYQANNQIVVTVGDIGQAGTVYDAVVSAGANLAGDIRFALKDDSQLRQQALRDAVKAARAKADALAAELGLTILGVDAVLDEGTSGPVVQVERLAAPRAADSAPTQVIPGELTVNARVRVVFRY